MACLQKFDAISIEISNENGTKNYSPATGSTELTFGGEVVGDNVITENGRNHAGTKIEAGELKFDLPWSNDMDFEDFYGCSTIVITSGRGDAWILDNARLKSAITLKSGESIASVEYVGDVIRRV